MPDPTPFELSLQAVIDKADALVQDLDDRISALTPNVTGVKSFDPIKAATKLKRDADGLILTLIRDSILVDYRNEINDINNGPIVKWKPGDDLPLYQENMVIEADTRNGAGVLVLDASVIPEGLGRANVTIKDKYYSFRKNPVTVIFGTLDDSGYYVGSWHVNTIDEENGYGRVDLNEDGASATFALITPSAVGLPPADYPAYMVVDLPDMGDVQEGAFYNGSVEDYVTSAGDPTTFKAINHVDGSRSIFGTSFANGERIHLGLSEDINLEKTALIVSGRPHKAGYVPGDNDESILVTSHASRHKTIPVASDFTPFSPTIFSRTRKTQVEADVEGFIYALGKDSTDDDYVLLLMSYFDSTGYHGSTGIRETIANFIAGSGTTLTSPTLVDVLDTVCTLVSEDANYLLYRFTSLIAIEGVEGVELLYIQSDFDFDKVDFTPFGEPSTNFTGTLGARKVVSYGGVYTDYVVAGRLIDGFQLFEETGGETHTWAIETIVYELASGDWEAHIWTEDVSDVIGPQGSTNPVPSYSVGSITAEVFGSIAYSGYHYYDVSRYGGNIESRGNVYFSAASGLKYFGASVVNQGASNTVATATLTDAGDDFDETLKLWSGGDGIGVIGYHSDKIYYLYPGTRYKYDLDPDLTVADAKAAVIGSNIYILALITDQATPSNNSMLYVFSIPDTYEAGYPPSEDEYPLPLLGTQTLDDSQATALAAFPSNKPNSTAINVFGNGTTAADKTFEEYLELNALESEYSWMLRIFDADE